MSGLHLPPAGPPDHEIQTVLEMLRTAREQLQAAEARLRRAEEFEHPYLRPTARMTARVLLASRQREVELWGGEVHWLEDEARKMGLRP